MEHPIANMPRIISIYRGTKKLIVVEEYIEGVTLSDLLEEGIIKQDKAVRLVRDVCVILRNLHTLKHPIIHRDVKPSNILLGSDSKVYLLDMNMAKWYEPEEIEDTKMLGTKYFAAPEQLGYGFSASTDKTDIYAFGMLLNMLVTGKLPKEEKATGKL